MMQIDVEKDIRGYQSQLKDIAKKIQGLNIVAIKIEGILDYLNGQVKVEGSEEKEGKEDARSAS